MWYQIIALLIWSSSFIAAKFSYSMLDPYMLVQLRLLIAALIVLPACVRYAPRVAKQHWPLLCLVTFANYVAVLLLQLVGLQHTSAASAITLIGLEPLLMVFLGHFFLGDRAQWHHWVCGSLAFIGVAVLIAGGAEQTGNDQISLWGCMLVLLAGVVFALAVRPTKRLVQQIGASTYTSVSLVVSVFMCLPFTLLFSHTETMQWTWTGVAGLLYLGIACSWLAFKLWIKGTPTVDANMSGLLTALEPIFGVFLAVLLLGERITWISWVGIALVLIATIGAAMWPRWVANK